MVCWDNTSEVFLPNCGHICLCIACCRSLDQRDHIPNVIVWEPHTTPTQQMAEGLMGLNAGKIYIIVSAGMGCCWYIRRDDIGQPIDTFFMHSDNWGQYGPGSSDVPQMENFIRGYTQLHIDS